MSKVDIFAGYSFAHVSENGFGLNFNGGSASAAYNLTPMFGLIADFGGYHTNSFNSDATAYIYLFGPRVNFHEGKWTPFAQFLLGGAHISGNGCVDVRVRDGGVIGCNASDNNFALALGGGLDYNVNQHIAIRAAQVEYLMTRFFSQTQNGVRVSAGVVFRF
jgi:opacity protein-like surface antigen